jgi:hypothetical protein
MMARREIYVYPLAELTIVKRLRVRVIVEMFYGVVFRGRRYWVFCRVIKG